MMKTEPCFIIFPVLHSSFTTQSCHLLFNKNKIFEEKMKMLAYAVNDKCQLGVVNNEWSTVYYQINTVSNKMSIKFIKSVDNLSLYFSIHIHFHHLQY